VSDADHDLPELGRMSLEPGHRLAGPTADAPAAAEPSPAGANGRSTSPRTWRRWTTPAAFTVAGAALFCAFLRLSGTSAVNSDSSNVMLIAWDMLHGNLLLHGWYLADVSLYTTELPQYALLESFLGLHPETAHVAAAMTYTLSVLLAALLARRGESGRAGIVRMVVAAGIMVAPQLGVGVYTLVMVVDHIGTSVPLLVIWLLLDRFDRRPPRWWVPVLTALLLAWVLIADPLVLVVGVAPLALVGAIRFVQGVAARDGSRWVHRARAQWYPLSLVGAAAAAYLLARLAERLLTARGSFVVHPVPLAWRWEPKDILALWRFLELYGADYRGLTGASFAFAILHLVSVVLVAWSVLLVVTRFLAGTPLVDQGLTVAILLNVALYAVTTASEQGAHEIAVVAPMGAALAARTLVGRVRWPRIRLVGYAMGALVLVGYLGGLGYELTQPSVPPENSTLTSWLTAHGLRDGLAGYWQASSVTVGSGGWVTVRALSAGALRPYLWLANVSWYDPRSNYANFVVIDTQPAYVGWVPRATIQKYAGPPARVYRTGPYLILVWDKNVLASIPPQTSAGTTTPGR
jgi:hypothetical protein